MVLAGPAPALSDIMTKDGKAVQKPELVMTEEPGLSKESAVP